jgi:hypothetical protein
MWTFIALCFAIGFAGAMVGVAVSPWIALLVLTLDNGKKPKKEEGP